MKSEQKAQIEALTERQAKQALEFIAALGARLESEGLGRHTLRSFERAMDWAKGRS